MGRRVRGGPVTPPAPGATHAAPADIAVIVATIGRIPSLRRCLEAILGGRMLPSGIVVVSQADPPLTLDELALPASAGCTVTLLSQARRGVSAARNLAIRASRTAIVAVTDDDCVPDAEWVSVIARTLDQTAGAAAVTGRVLPLGPDVAGLYAVSSRRSTERRTYSGKSAPWQAGTGGNFAVRRTWLDRVGLYDERLGPGTPGRAAEDLELIYRLLSAGADIAYEPDLLIHHARQSLERRLASRWSYGFGAGAFCGLQMRRRDRRAPRMLASWVRGQSSQLAGAPRGTRVLRGREYFLSVSGMARGLAYGLRMSPDAPATAS